MRSSDVAIIGGGPAGLSAGLNLARGRRSTVIFDDHRPRHSATLVSHGYLTRDGVSPSDLRRLGREEFERYAEADVAQARVQEVRPLQQHETDALGWSDGLGFEITATGVRGADDVRLHARRVLVATGLREELPRLPSIRVFYGTAMHSCIECDAREKTGGSLALIGETTDIFARALHLSQFTSDLLVFTNGGDTVTPDEERELAGRGIAVERRPIEDLVGVQSTMTGVRLADGTVIPRAGGFVRPRWHAPVEFWGGASIVTDDWGLLVVDEQGCTSVPGLYAAGDVVPPGPQQLIIAAGSGARVANNLQWDLINATRNITRTITAPHD